MSSKKNKSSLSLEEILNPTLNDKRKPVETEMYWWLNKRRPFFIGNDYKIVLESISSSSKSVKILIVNIKNNKTEAEAIIDDSSSNLEE